VFLFGILFFVYSKESGFWNPEGARLTDSPRRKGGARKQRLNLTATEGSNYRELERN
jgi:hypothetical protein